MPTPQLGVDFFRFYQDGTQAGSTALAAENVDISVDVSVADVNLQLRIMLDEGGFAAPPATDDWTLQYNLNAAGWVSVGAASTVVKSFPSASLTDGEATTQRLSNGAGGVFTAGKVDEADGTVDNSGYGAADDWSEFLWSLTVIKADVVNGDSIDFRVLRNGATTGITYSVTPTITIVEGSAVRRTLTILDAGP